MAQKRKIFSKKIRQAVFDRYRGRCVYCGCKFTSIRDGEFYFENFDSVEADDK